MWQKVFNWIKRIILTIAVFSIYVFLFQYLEAEHDQAAYLAICGTILTLYLYAKHNKV